MWHSDLDPANIFVDPADPIKILGIIDWQSVHLSPLFLQARRPSLIELDGPMPEGLDPTEVPHNFDDLSADEQKAATTLQAAQLLYKLHEIELRQRNKDILWALHYRKTLACKITALAGSLFSDGEPIFNGMLIAVEKDWANIVGRNPDCECSVPCPLKFSAQDRAIQSEHEAQWKRGFELMGVVLE